jgi:Na+/melibiose symporter-like transporter
MNEMKMIDDKSTWAIGGGVLMGVGAGFFFLQESPLAFVACILLGIGLGLMVTSIISGGKRQKT